MPRIPGTCIALALILAAPAAWAEAGFDPHFEALVLVNLSVPDRVETAVELEVGQVVFHSGPRRVGVEPFVTSLDSRDLAGRSPRWFQFTAEPAIVDSLTIGWEGVQLLVDEDWVEPLMPPTSLAISLDRRVEAGEVVVINLRWNPDAQVPNDPAWQPSISIESLEEPPPGARLYVSEEASGIVAVHDRDTGRMMRGLPVGGTPRDLAWDPLRQRLYVVVAGTDEFLAIDPVGRETIRRLPLSFGSDPTRILISADRQHIAVLAPGRNSVFVFGAASLQEIGRVRVGRDPVAMAEHGRSGRIFVTSRTGGQVDVIDPQTATVEASFTNLDDPGQIVSVSSGYLAVGQNRGRRISVIDPITGAIQVTVDLCGPAQGMTFVARFDRLYAVTNSCAAVSVVRPIAGLELGSMSLPSDGGIPTLGPQGSDIFVPLPDLSQVLVLSASQGGRTRVVDTGPGPWRVVTP